MNAEQSDEEWEKAERIYKELLHEEACLWYISDSYGSKVMVKIPSASIKALIAGCRIEFLFGKDNKEKPTKFHAGVRVYDDPIHYLSVTGIHRFLDEHISLERIMNRTQTYIHFHNELNVCTATASLSFDTKDQLKVLNFIGNPNNLYIGDFDSHASRSLDCFQYSLTKHEDLKNVYEIETLVVQGKLESWQMMENHFIGLNEANKIVLNNTDEGGTFEQQVWASLESLFEKQLHKNPRIPFKNGTRELTDLFAYSEYGIFLIETKALGILGASNERTMDRKVAGLQKQIEKAIDQLTGAVKKIREDSPVLDNKGNEILFDRKLLPHCIILVSELLPFGEWQHIVYKMMVAMVEAKIYLHLVDLREFMRYVGMARGSVNRLDYYLMKRAEQFTEHQTVHIKVKEVFEKDDK